MRPPFLSFYTPTYKRPQGLARCLASVAQQTAIAQIEQVVIPDHVGVGIHGMYAQIATHADAVHGLYVHVLADDDVLYGPDVVAEVQAFAEARGFPPLILVGVQKGSLVIAQPSWPPVCGGIDLGCLILRRDVWLAHKADWGQRYEGDYDMAAALHRAGVEAAFCPVLFLRGGQSRGAPEETGTMGVTVFADAAQHYVNRYTDAVGIPLDATHGKATVAR